MPTFGHKDTVLSGCTLYDDGGPSGNYSSRCEATYTFHTAGGGNYYRIRLDYFELPHELGYSLLEIYNGDSTQMTAENRIFSSADYYWYSWRRFYFSRDSVITIRFQADDDAPTSGWWVELCEAGGITAQNVDYEMLDSTTAKITWDEPDIDIHWILQYCYSSYNNPEEAMMDTNNVFTTLYVDTNFVIISGLQVGQRILFNLFTESSAPCHGGGVWVICPCVTPQDFHVNYDSDSMRVTWRYDPKVAFWSFWGDDPTGFDTVLPGTDTSWAVPYQCTDALTYYFVLEGNCLQPVICNFSWMYPQPVQCSNVSAVLRQDVTDSSIAFTWKTWNMLMDTAMGYITAYRDLRWPTDSIAILDTIFDEPYADTIYGLEPNTNYEVWVYNLCDWGIRSCGNPATIATSLDNCIDYINIWDLNKIHLTWGYYDNIDSVKHINGYDWNGEGNIYFGGSGRQQPITDTNQYDSRTNGALRCVPPGDKASLRLGDDFVNREAESITYDYFVDSTDKDILVLKYAIVMQNPNHTPENQPHFTMEILDSLGNVIDTQCCYADFYAADNMVGWDSVPGTNIIFKDWTTVGIDIAPYHGQTIKVRLINKDCAEGGHFAYAYFTIHCDNKRIYLVNMCDATDSIHLQAPLGFEYQWTRMGSSTVLGNKYDITIPVDTNVYQCRCSFVGKPNCNFTISTYSIHVNPHASMHYWVDTCNQKAYFHSDSYVYMDTGFEAYTKQIVEHRNWVVNGDTIFDADSIVVDLAENINYHVTHLSTLSHSWCTDSVVADIPVRFAYEKRILGPADICLGDSLALTAHIFPVNSPSFRWLTGGGTDSVSHWLPNMGDTLFVVEMEDNNCMDTLYHSIRVHLPYSDTLIDTICQGRIYGQGFNVDSGGVFTQHLHTALYNCDSLMTLRLTIDSTKYSAEYDTVCQGHYVVFGNHTYAYAGSFNDTLHTARGCDSVRTLHLSLTPTTYDTTRASFCEGGSYVFEEAYYSEAGSYNRLTTNVAGCDSIRTLILTQRDTQLVRIDTLTCNGEETFLLFGDTVSHPGVYSVLLQNAQGCDSTLQITLRMGHSFYGVINDTLCQGDSAWFEGSYYSAAGNYAVHLATLEGCDSVMTLRLTIDSTRYSAEYDTVCQGHYVVFGNHTYAYAGSFNDTLHTARGCDSVCTLHLSLTPTTYDTTRASFCEGGSYVFEEAYYSEAGSYNRLTTNVAGCDSIRTLILTQRDTQLVHIDTLICNGEETFLLFGDTVSHPGVYSILLQNAQGCDSTLQITLRMGHSFYGVINDTLCQGDSAWFEGSYYTAAGNYAVHLATPEGCDSVRTLALAVSPREHTYCFDTLCHGAFAHHGIHSYSETGQYSDTLRTWMGCDSVSTLILTVYPTYDDSIAASICKGETYAFAGVEYGRTGVYYDRRQSHWGCDSNTTLMLTVYPTYLDTFYASINEGEVYSGHGFTESEEGVYTHVAQTQYGCDSITVLALTVLVGLDETLQQSLAIYPNPTTGLLTVETEGNEPMTATVYDMTGRLVSVATGNAPRLQIDMAALAAGTYLLRVSTNVGEAAFRIEKR